MENIPIPILKVDKVENDGCPFAGYEKKHREAKKKLARKMKAGNCEICDAKFDDEDAHVKTSQHQNALNKKRSHFQKDSFAFCQCSTGYQTATDHRIVHGPPVRQIGPCALGKNFQNF